MDSEPPEPSEPQPEPLAVYTTLLPGRFRWNRWLAFVDDHGKLGPIALARHRNAAKEQAEFLWRHRRTRDNAHKTL